jgi:glycerophosphoryl diester phosphodiesterase
VERLPDVRQENTIFNGRYQVPTFQEIIDLAKRNSGIYHRHIGIAPETKHPTYFDSIGLCVGAAGRQTARAAQPVRLRVQLLQLTSAGPPRGRTTMSSAATRRHTPT